MFSLINPHSTVFRMIGNNFQSRRVVYADDCIKMSAYRIEAIQLLNDLCPFLYIYRNIYIYVNSGQHESGSGGAFLRTEVALTELGVFS